MLRPDGKPPGVLHYTRCAIFIADTAAVFSRVENAAHQIFVRHTKLR
jgi:hypothetical protein